MAIDTATYYCVTLSKLLAQTLWLPFSDTGKVVSALPDCYEQSKFYNVC